MRCGLDGDGISLRRPHHSLPLQGESSSSMSSSSSSSSDRKRALRSSPAPRSPADDAASGVSSVKQRFSIDDLLVKADDEPSSHASPVDSDQSDPMAAQQLEPSNGVLSPHPLLLPQLAAFLQQAGLLPGSCAGGPQMPQLPLLPGLLPPWATLQALAAAATSASSSASRAPRLCYPFDSTLQADLRARSLIVKTDDSNDDALKKESPSGSPVESEIEEDPLDMAENGSDNEMQERGGGNHYGAGDGAIQDRKKKTRTVFTRQQVSQLESTFDMKRYLSSNERTALAQRLNISETQVKIWFQNRRNKFKRQANGEEAATASVNALQLHRTASLYGQALAAAGGGPSVSTASQPFSSLLQPASGGVAFPQLHERIWRMF